VIGPFPWDPFPPGEPEPKGPDPVPSLAFRSAVSSADAYRSVRLAFRRENGTLRVGNRFLPDGRYRQVAFLAFGNAATSMALAALHVMGDRLTQGFLAGPDPVPPEIPFRGVVIPPGWGSDPETPTAVTAAIEIAAELNEQDLLLVLLSPGALRGLVLPPNGWAPEQFSTWLSDASARGATGREVGLLARVYGLGVVGGRLPQHIGRADVATFVVERGDGPAIVGGGPMTPVSMDERTEARAIVQRIGIAEPPLPEGPASPRVEGAGPGTSDRIARPVVVASPGDALRGAADSLFDKGWTSRLAFLELRDGAEASADRFLARTEELIQAERLDASSRTKGIATFAMLTMGLPEGVDEGPALGQFLSRVQAGLRRREMSVGLFRTSGPIGGDTYPCGGVVGPPTDPAATWTRGRARAVLMRAGITDVGLLAVAVNPTPTAGPSAKNGGS
jgi:hypothetical protein